jgi:hypothetical protein
MQRKKSDQTAGSYVLSHALKIGLKDRFFLPKILSIGFPKGNKGPHGKRKISGDIGNFGLVAVLVGMECGKCYFDM